MVGPNVGKSGNTGKVGQKPKLSRIDQLRLDKQAEILQHMGVSNPEQLPAGTKKALDTVLASKNLGPIDTAKAADSLKTDFARDFARTVTPGAASDKSVQLPGRGEIPLAKDNGDGSFKLIGAAAGKDSPIPDLMSQLGIDPHSMGPNVKGVLEGARGAELGKGADKNWDKFARKLAAAKVKDTPTGQLGKLAGVGGLTTSAPANRADAVSQAADLGLEKTARTENDKSVDVSTTPDAIMNTQAVRDPTAAGTREAAVAHIETVLAQSGMTDKERAQFKPILDKVLKDGQLGAKSATDKSWAIVRATHKETTGKSMPRDFGAEGSTAHNAASLIAADQLMNLAATTTGAKLDMSRAADLVPIVKGYTKVSAAKTRARGGPKNGAGVNLGAEQSSTQSTESAKSGKADSSKAPAAKQAAHEAARALGLDPEDPQQRHVVGDMERAFHQVMSGSKSDADTAMRGLKWVERQTGDKTGAMSKHLSEILKNAPEDSQVHQMAKQVAMQKVAHCAAVGPETYVQQQAAMAAGGGGGGMPPMGGIASMGGMPPMGGGPGVPMPYGMADQAMLGPMRQMVGASILLDPSLSHEDKITLFLMHLMSSMDQDRMRKMHEIADLSAKDEAKKMSSDAGTMARANEIKEAKAGGGDAAKVGNKGAPKTGANAQQSTAETPATAQNPATAQTAAASNAGPKKTANASSQSATAQSQSAGATEPANSADPAATPGGPDSRGPGGAGSNPDVHDIRQAQGELGNQSPEGPKSLELQFSELERMDKLRSILFDSLMEIIKKHDQSTKDVWRGM